MLGDLGVCWVALIDFWSCSVLWNIVIGWRVVGCSAQRFGLFMLWYADDVVNVTLNA